MGIRCFRYLCTLESKSFLDSSYLVTASKGHIRNLNPKNLSIDVNDNLFLVLSYENTIDADFDTGNSRYKARERYSFGVSDPLGVFGSPGAT